MKKLNEITEAMEQYNREHAPGSECTEWGDYVADCYSTLDVAPWVDNADEIDVPDNFAEYWLDIANQ